jgi:hypothetical protein
MTNPAVVGGFAVILYLTCLARRSDRKGEKIRARGMSLASRTPGTRERETVETGVP